MSETITLRQRVFEIVESQQGIKSVDLELKLMSEFPTATKQQVMQAVSEAVQSVQIKRIEYTTPSQSWVVRSFYLPAGSQLVN